jgi:hypothetical protein
MKREQIINKIYDKIRDDLLHALLLYWEEDDANKYPLVDHLSSGNDISTGRDEIDNLIEQIEIEPLIDAILALPLDVPSEEELYEWAGYCAGNTTENHDKRIVYQAALVLGAKWMKNGIIKRNTKK